MTVTPATSIDITESTAADRRSLGDNRNGFFKLLIPPLNGELHPPAHSWLPSHTRTAVSIGNGADQSDFEIIGVT
ncbi:hypothetical protein MAUB_58200 [Mycolicibacterium aubagnense]|uniref:Uncharacterized protein n=1 Tax=Mycolicibacterium aubagnense TaxID=319707 RepID=A0ABN5Z1A6_9MYCO|nr:hypothetical protein MAUB_58200 [Mycolicibacterium aubagnense]